MPGGPMQQVHTPNRGGPPPPQMVALPHRQGQGE
jgi:hypothetical protein